MRKRALIVSVFILLFVVLGLLLFYNTRLYDEFLKNRIENRMEKTYGVSFKVSDLDEKQVFIPDFGISIGFTAYSGDGIFMQGECDWKGTVLRESYIHYYYAPAMDRELENIVGNCFDDCCIVRDCCQFGGNKAIIDMIEVGTITSSEDYIKNVNREDTYFRVYLKKNITDEQLQGVLDCLKLKEYMGNVYFIPVQDDLFKELKASGIECYYGKSSMSDIVSKHITCIDKQEVEKMVYDQFEYIKAQYVPKWGTAEIVKK